MTRIGFHISHEQHAPSVLLRDVMHAEQVGFDEAMCSDHLAPWLTTQGESGFAWSWLGAALARTSFPIGVVTAPGQSEDERDGQRDGGRREKSGGRSERGGDAHGVMISRSGRAGSTRTLATAVLMFATALR